MRLSRGANNPAFVMRLDGPPKKSKPGPPARKMVSKAKPAAASKE
jgi:hypothetical protein